nr:hypothetical protein BdHM001_36280 [Bdellovibrio sp. HM001]
MFTLQVSTENPEVRFQLAFDPPPSFKSPGAAEDWALMNLPRGEYVEAHDASGELVFKGFVGLGFDYAEDEVSSSVRSAA